MQKLCHDRIGGQMMAGSMQLTVAFLKGACMLIKIAMLMCCLTWHLVTCCSQRHGAASLRYVFLWPHACHFFYFATTCEILWSYFCSSNSWHKCMLLCCILGLEARLMSVSYICLGCTAYCHAKLPWLLNSGGHEIRMSHNCWVFQVTSW